MHFSMLNRFAMTALAVVSVPFAAQAESTLEDVLALAYQNNPTIEAERQLVRSTDEQISEAWSSLLPSLNLSGSYGRTWTRTTGLTLSSTGGFATGTSNNTLDPKVATATLEQPLFTGGRATAAVAQIRALVDTRVQGLEGVVQQTMTQTVTAYMDVIASQSVVELNARNVEVLRRQLQAAQDRFDVGETTRTDVAQAEARLAGVENALIGAQAQLRTNRAALERLTGSPAGTLIAPQNLPPLPQSEEQAQQIAATRNPRILAAKAAARAAEKGISIARGEFLPTVVLRGQVQYAEGVATSVDEQLERSVSAIMSWPIFEGGASMSRTRQAKYDTNRAMYQVREAEFAVTEQVSNAWAQLRAARSSIQSSEAQVRANSIALDGVRQEAEVGARTTLDVLNAEQELLDARVSLVSAIRNEYVAAFSLLAATGELRLDTLGVPVETIDPTKGTESIFSAMFSSSTLD